MAVVGLPMESREVALLGILVDGGDMALLAFEAVDFTALVDRCVVVGSDGSVAVGPSTLVAGFVVIGSGTADVVVAVGPNTPVAGFEAVVGSAMLVNGSEDVVFTGPLVGSEAVLGAPLTSKSGRASTPGLGWNKRAYSGLWKTNSSTTSRRTSINTSFKVSLSINPFSASTPAFSRSLFFTLPTISGPTML